MKERLMASKSNARASEDAIAMLTEDHNKVKALFKQFEKLKEQDDADEEISDLVAQICAELTIHSTLEEEIFYPAVREAIDDDDLMDEADVEHASAKELIAELETGSPGDDHYNAKVTVLGEYVVHHVKEEEGEMFPKARKAIDTEAIGAELAARKSELMMEMGLGDDEEQDDDGEMPAPSKGKSERTSAPRRRGQ
ncbi:MAG TPA: hemerythrin domain-containing protein [Casimicrobiaceae bacterium]|nr:hemerythrin domain-containing protein [Casimicrobiaceae bacterium]